MACGSFSFTHATTQTMSHNCPCGSSLPLAACCGLYIIDGQPAPTAQALMRSRYTAFTLANVDYILRTYHSKTRPINQRQKILAWAKSLQWTGLEILSTEKGLEDDERAWLNSKPILSKTATHHKSTNNRFLKSRKDVGYMCRAPTFNIGTQWQ
jgi:SEC-C motif-containing protein